MKANTKTNAMKYFPLSRTDVLSQFNEQKKINKSHSSSLGKEMISTQTLVSYLYTQSSGKDPVFGVSLSGKNGWFELTDYEAIANSEWRHVERNKRTFVSVVPGGC